MPLPLTALCIVNICIRVRSFVQALGGILLNNVIHSAHEQSSNAMLHVH